MKIIDPIELNTLNPNLSTDGSSIFFTKPNGRVKKIGVVGTTGYSIFPCTPSFNALVPDKYHFSRHLIEQIRNTILFYINPYLHPFYIEQIKKHDKRKTIKTLSFDGFYYDKFLALKSKSDNLNNTFDLFFSPEINIGFDKLMVNVTNYAEEHIINIFVNHTNRPQFNNDFNFSIFNIQESFVELNKFMYSHTFEKTLNLKFEDFRKEHFEIIDILLL